MARGSGRIVCVLAALALAVFAAPAAARAVQFRGDIVRVPDGWPVYRLAAHPRLCVRLDRRAVYLGTPSADQRCPAGAIGRRRAILVEPPAGTRARGRTSSVPPAAATGTDSFTGLGFDACSAPSARSMANWASSPYRAVGVYIGGANRACSQPSLTSTWVGEQVAAGWHLIPTYVGLQSPSSSCSSCAKISSSRAGTQGGEAARDAVEDAEAVGIGPGSPIYFDMEAYARSSSATAATLAFLSAWTEGLHALGYVSGAYSSSSSGIADLAHAIGGSYTLPDEIWTANWNNAQNTLDPYLPSTAWASHDRIHQYRGGHNETYGLITINVDNDYVEAMTVGLGAAPAHPVLPLLTVKHVRPLGGTVKLWIRCGRPAGEECPGQIALRSRVATASSRTSTRLVRLGIGHRGFHLAGEQAHVFRVGLNASGAPLLRERGSLKAELLVATPGARATRAVQLRRAR